MSIYVRISTKKQKAAQTSQRGRSEALKMLEELPPRNLRTCSTQPQTGFFCLSNRGMVSKIGVYIMSFSS
jgi:hypothetical protein